MKKLLALFFIVSFLCFGEDIPDNKNIVKSSQMKEEIELLKNQVIELSSQVMKFNNEIDELKGELKGIEKKNGDNLGLTYNIDQIYTNSMKFYDKTIEETKEIYDKTIDDIDNSIGRAQWVLGIIFTVIMFMAGFFQIKNDKQLKEIKDDNRKETKNLENKFAEKIKEYEKQMKERIQEETAKLEDKFDKIIKKQEKDIKEIKQKIEKDKKIIEKDREIVEFNSKFSTAMSKVKPEEKIDELNKLQNLSNKFTRLQNIEIYFETAYQYVNLKKYQEAISNYNKVIKFNPNNKEAYNNRAEVQLLLKEYKLALLDLVEFIKINKKHQLGIDLSQDIYDEFKKYLEKMKDKNDLEQEVYKRLVVKDGFTIIEK